tara:strand:- start:22465 stop:23469 length:1005 start_codon:yes stop_codon:yes gene_type:complete
MKEQANIHQMLTWFLSKKSMHLDEEGSWVVEMIAKSICKNYNNLSNPQVKSNKLDVKIEFLEKKHYEDKDIKYLQPVIQLQDFINLNLKNYVIDFLVHGSLATMDYIKGWSDFDTLVIIKSEVIKDHTKLISFRKKMIEAQSFLLKLDPLQHHGFIYSTEFDLDYYLSHCMPVEVLRESKSFISSSNLVINYNRSNSDAKILFKNKVSLFKKAFENGELHHHKYKGEYLLEDYKNNSAMYQMKYFLAVLMSLPVLYLDALDKACYKRESFEIVKSDFLNEWEIMDKASIIRLYWSHKEAHPFKNNEIPLWLKEELGYSYFERAYKLAQAMLSKL